MFKKIALTTMLLTVTSFAQATAIDGNVYSNCGAVQLTSVATSEFGANLLTKASSYNATQCKGYAGANDSGQYGYDYNIGQYADGLLNGESTNQNGQLFTGYEFLSGVVGNKAGWVDVDKDGDLDPGWIGLAKQDGSNAVSYNTVAGNSTQAFVLDNPATSIVETYQLFKFELTGANSSTGTWKLTTYAAAIQAVKSILGENYFDHLAIVLKSGNIDAGPDKTKGKPADQGGSNSSFMVYDFNFNDIFGASKENLSLAQNYTLAGTWNTSDFGNKALSHISIAAHDPHLTPTTDVPAPSTLALFGLSLLGLGVRRFRK